MWGATTAYDLMEDRRVQTRDVVIGRDPHVPRQTIQRIEERQRFGLPHPHPTYRHRGVNSGMHKLLIFIIKYLNV